jgi:hypothetical protein
MSHLTGYMAPAHHLTDPLAEPSNEPYGPTNYPATPRNRSFARTQTHPVRSAFAFGATLAIGRVRLVRLLLREVRASGLRCVRGDSPGRVLRFGRTREVRAKERAQTLWVASDLLSENFRSENVRHIYPPLVSFDYTGSMTDGRSSVKRSFDSFAYACTRTHSHVRVCILTFANACATLRITTPPTGVRWGFGTCNG